MWQHEVTSLYYAGEVSCRVRASRVALGDRSDGGLSDRSSLSPFTPRLLGRVDIDRADTVRVGSPAPPVRGD